MKREAASLISFYDFFSSEEEAIVRDHLTKIKIHLKPGSTGEQIHTAFAHFLTTTETNPFLMDIQLGKANLDIPPAV
jgi:hypothetical protein